MKIFFKLIFIIIIIFSVFVLHMTFIGIETNKFNNQIQNRVMNVNKDLEIELKEIKIIFNPLKLKLDIKTLGPKFRLNDKIIQLESIKSEISLVSFFQKKYSLEHLDVSTKSLEIKNLISFIRKLKNTPELFILEKIIKKGYLIADLKINFDRSGKIKEDFQIEGLINDLHGDILKNYKVENLDLVFDFKKSDLTFQNIDALINNKNFIAKKVSVKKENKDFLINGDFDFDKLILNSEELNTFFKLQPENFQIENIQLSVKNNFSFKLNKKYKIDDFEIFSDMKIDKISIQSHNRKKLKEVFPKIKKNLNFFNHQVKIEYSKKKLSINGNGKVLFQDENDKINYSISKKKNTFEFYTSFEIDKNPFIFEILNFDKENDSKLIIELKGEHELNNLTKISSLKIKEKENIFYIQELTLDKKFKIKDLKNFTFEYIDRENQKNSIRLFNKNDIYFLKGQNFNANHLIENLLNNEQDNRSIFFKKDVKINVEIDTVYLDKVHRLSKLKGNLNFENKELKNSNLSARFSENEKFKFTVNSNQNEKITILTLDKAEPIIKRYNFIKGFEEGVLDFYSSKKENMSKSTLKIYNFKLKELPVLTKILTLASLQGIADILSGEGIRFDEFEMNFQTKNNLITIDEIYSIGPAISILMDGYIEKNKLVSLRGTLVPATTINKAIGSIPILGKILVGKKTGEGVFGVSFKIKGPPKNLETTVNPIKTLTPRFITRTLEKLKNIN